MTNERNTENIVISKLKKLGYVISPDQRIKNKAFVESQKTVSADIDKLLQNASKSKAGNRGYPEYIITHDEHPNFVCIIECKGNLNKHQSENLNKYKDFAVDGCKLYSSYISKEKDVLSIAFSGERHDNFKVSHYFQIKGEANWKKLNLSNDILSIDSYTDRYKEIRFKQDYQSLMNYVKTLNKSLHSKKIPEYQRALLFSAVLLALEDDDFLNTYSKISNTKTLAKNIVDTVSKLLANSSINPERIKVLEYAYSFIKNQTSLVDDGYVRELIRDVHKNVRPFIKNKKYYDVLSEAYIEFLKYANADKALGIVLTPPHITDLFCELANVNKNSVVLDNCCGTAGFLISAMAKMVEDAKGDKNKIEEIKNNQLLGIEFQDSIYPLACSNMIIHGDGKTNLVKGDCFKELDKVIDKKPDIGFQNPPYPTEKDDIPEFDFLFNLLDAVQKNGTVITIIPTSCVLSTNQQQNFLKEKLLEKHTLEAVLSMPDELFYNSKVSTVTCIVVITAHQPHPNGKETYFGYWKNDGFEKMKYQGRVDSNNKWNSIKSNWISSFKNKTIIPGFSIMKEVGFNDEWIAEAYFEADYKLLKTQNFIETIKHYLGFRFVYGNVINVSNSPRLTNKNLTLNTSEWKNFKCSEIFNSITLGKAVHSNNAEISEGNIPYISRTKLLNGTQDFIHYEDLNRPNAITIGAEGFCAFYQPTEFVTGNKINIIRYDGINVFNAQFICVVLNHIMKNRFSYGYAIVQSRLEKLIIKLPANSDGLPDWIYMENFIKSLPYSDSLDK
tara:strand:- start:179 stop:2527 length:2349 start_codon:yes stop_codon:yes gene_type:complete